MLNLYSNIKRLRKLNNMSQQELAEAVGYKGKSMIAQVENGRVDLSASMISKFAEVFHVTELELMGLNGLGVTDSSLAAYEQLWDYYVQNKEDREFIELYHAASPEIRQLVLAALKTAKPDP